MNYFITCPPRSGSTYLCNWLVNCGVPCAHEIFAPTAIGNIMALVRNGYDDPMWSEAVLCDMDIGLCHSLWKHGGGFKMPYNVDKLHIVGHISTRKDVRVIHILRPDLVEWLASWQFLNVYGISRATKDGTLWGVDGKARRLDWKPYAMDLDVAELLVENVVQLQKLTRQMLTDRPYYMEIEKADLFGADAPDRLSTFLDVDVSADKIPPDVKTPRPKASELWTNYEAVVEAVEMARDG